MCENRERYEAGLGPESFIRPAWLDEPGPPRECAGIPPEPREDQAPQGEGLHSEDNTATEL